MPIDAMKPGMVLDQDVRDRSGRFLLGEGTTITDKHLRTFRAWGVTEVQIREILRQRPHPSPSPLDIPPTLDPALIARAEFLFRHTNRSHPAIQELFAHYVDRISAGGQPSGEGNL